MGNQMPMKLNSTLSRRTEAKEQFSDTLQGAITRFKAVERRLKKDSNLYLQYVKFTRDYLQLGHMLKLSPEDVDKLRVAFDGSIKKTNGKSLNEALHIGPSIQNVHILLLSRYCQNETTNLGGC